MSELPEGWAWATVGELAQAIEYGSSAKAEETGDVPVLRMGNIEDGRLRLEDLKYFPAAHEELPELLLKPGDILFNRTNSVELVGKTAVYEGTPSPCSFASYLLRVRLNDYDPKLLAYYINSPFGRDWIASVVSQQVGQANVNGSKLRSLSVPVPPSTEQRRIVVKIETLTAKSRRAKEALDVIPALLKRFRQSVLASAFRGDLTAGWREKNPDVEPAEELLKRIRVERRRRWEEAELAKMRAKGKVSGDDRWKDKYEEPAPVDASDLPELPEGWCWASPREVFIWGSGKFLPRDAQREGDYPVYGGNGINGTHNECVVAFSTIVVGRVGADCGNVHVTKGPAWITDNAIYASVVPQVAHLSFWELALRRAGLRTAARGGGQPFVSQETLNAVIVPFPPAAEQQNLMSALMVQYTAVERALGTLLSVGAHLASLDRAILAKAFRGELVPQDPTDEPASVLLERLRAEAEQNAKIAPARTRRRPAASPPPARPDNTHPAKKPHASPRSQPPARSRG